MFSMPSPTPRHQYFILLLWQDGVDAAQTAPGWRLSLENPQTGERKGFHRVEDLTAFLTAWMQTQFPDEKEQKS